MTLPVISGVLRVFHMIPTRFPQRMRKTKPFNDACLLLYLTRFPQKYASPFSLYKKYGINNGNSNCR